MKQLLIFLLIALLILSSGNLYAQKQGQALIDSLLKELPKVKEDTNKANLLGGLAFGYRRINPDERLKFAKLELALSQRLGFKKGIADASVNIGGVYLYQGNNPEALKNYLTAEKTYEEIDNKKGIASALGNISNYFALQDNYPEAIKNYMLALKNDESINDKKGIGNCYNNLGNIFQYQGNYPEAIKYHFAALKIREEMGDKEGIAFSNTNIGIIYDYLHNDSEALKYYYASLKMSEELNDKQGIGSSYCNIGSLYRTMHNYSEALTNLSHAREILEGIGEKHFLSITYHDIGDLYQEMGNYPESIKNLSSALEIDKKIGNEDGIASTYISIGYVYALSKKNKEAQNYLTEGLKLSTITGNVQNLQDAYGILTGLDSIIGNWKEAYINNKLYNKYKDSLHNTLNTKKLVQSQMQYDFDKKEAISKVEQEKKDAIAGKELQKQKLVRNGFVGGFAVVLLFAGIFFNQRNKIKAGKKQSDELLLNILPAEVAEELKIKGSAEAKLIDEVTVLFTDFKGFTVLSEKLSPKVLVAQINDCFSAFDLIMEKYGVEKIKTIGDSYMAAGGLPTPNITHPDDVVKAALEIQEFMQRHKSKKEASGELFFEIRIGVHTGPVVAGIVGVKKFQYDIWGDTVNTASRMESSGGVGKVNISQTTYEMVKDKFSCEYRGEIEAKGKGQLKMYFVRNIKENG